MRVMKSGKFKLLSLALGFRIVMLIYGIWQDEHSRLKYTDIDYYVFTDASRFIHNGQSPYKRATYRYTPILAWILLPSINLFFSFGKILFVIGDILTGYLIINILKSQGICEERALAYSCIWLFNPMVATISTRGSSEGILAAIIISLLTASLNKKPILSGILAGFAIHFKIYPIIYVASIFLYIGNGDVPIFNHNYWILRWITWKRLKFSIFTVMSFIIFTGICYYIYGFPFIFETYLYHLSRSDHRHNFSPYNIPLYYSSWNKNMGNSSPSLFIKPESIAFIPQLLLSAIIIPFIFAKKDLIGTMFAQTLAFVTFNKVCTSQYFMWYLVFLALILPDSFIMSHPYKSISVLISWIISQSIWLQQAYKLEFLGISTFYPGLFYSSILFFAVNCWLTVLAIDNIRVNKVIP